MAITKASRMFRFVSILSIVSLIGAPGWTEEKPRPEAASADTIAHEETTDFGKRPWVVDIEKLTVDNTDFRAAKWTGTSMQLTVMSIKVGGQIGLEKHDGIDQFIRIEQGKGRVTMGRSKDDPDFVADVEDDWSILIPSGYWHNLVNTGESELKAYSIYGPPEHPVGTVHRTFEESEADHHHP